MDENSKVFGRGLERTLELLERRKVKIIVVGSVPEYNIRVPETLGKLYHFTAGTKLPKEYLITRKEFVKLNINVLNAFKSSNIYNRATYIDTFNLFYNGAFCDYIDNGNNVYYFDGNHLTYLGSKTVVDEIIKNI